MDRKLINPLIVTGIADAVRAKGKTTEPIKVADLPNAIMNLPEGGGVGEDTSALLDAIGVESREDTGMANGLAQALTDTPTEQMWSGERTTADGMPIKDGVAFVSALKGKTLKVNQLSANDAGTYTTQYFTTTNLGNGSFRVVGQGVATYTFRVTAIEVTLVMNHKYLIFGCPKGGSLQSYSLRYNSNGFAETGNGVIVTYDGTAGDSSRINLSRLQIAVAKNVSVDVVFTPRLIDLTDIYGSGNEPTTPIQYAIDRGYKTLADIPFDPYTPTTNLQSFAPNAIVSKGRNLWDGNGVTPNKYLNDNGELISSSTSSVSDYVRIMPNVGYCLIGVGGSNPSLCWYDENMTFISAVRYKSLTMVVETAPSNARFIRFSFLSASEEVCLSISGSTDGTYTPYREESRLDFDLTTIVDSQGNQLFPDGELKSAGSVCDMVDYANNMAVRGKKMIGVKVFDGTESWGATSYEDRIYPRITVTGVKYRGQLSCAQYKYMGLGYGSMSQDMAMSLDWTNPIIFFRDDRYTSVAEWKAHLAELYANGKPLILIYELAEPIDGEAPLVKSFYPVQSNGTEEAVTDSIVPMNAEIRYRVDTESLLTQSASLLRYSNEVTGANDTSLGDAVKTLTDSYK